MTQSQIPIDLQNQAQPQTFQFFQVQQVQSQLQSQPIRVQRIQPQTIDIFQAQPQIPRTQSIQIQQIRPQPQIPGIQTIQIQSQTTTYPTISEPQYYYKIGNLYIKSKESEYLNNHYQKIDISMTDEEYYKQLQPFYESDNIQIYKIDNDNIYSFYVRNYSIYDLILDKLNIYNKTISNKTKTIYVDCKCSCTDDEEAYDDESVELADKYNNAKYIPRSLINTKENIIKHFYQYPSSFNKKYERYSEMKKLTNMKSSDFTRWNLYCCMDYTNNNFWQDINDIFIIHKDVQDIYDIMKVDSKIFKKFMKKLKKYKYFFGNIDDIISNTIDNLLYLDNITMAAILIDKMNLYSEFQKCYFDKESRIKQIDAALEYQRIFKEVYPKIHAFIDDEDMLCNSSINKYFESFDPFESNTTNEIYSINAKYSLYHGDICIGSIGLVFNKEHHHFVNVVKRFVSDIDTKYTNLQFIYDSCLSYNIEEIKYVHSLKFYCIGNKCLFIGNCDYTKNKYLSNLIIDNSKLFEEYLKIYSSDDVYNLDIAKELRDYENFNKLFSNNKTMGETICKLIEGIKIDYVDNEMKDIFYNMYYLQMFDVIKMIELITGRKIPIDLDKVANTDDIIKKYFK